MAAAAGSVFTQPILFNISVDLFCYCYILTLFFLPNTHSLAYGNWQLDGKLTQPYLGLQYILVILSSYIQCTVNFSMVPIVLH